MTMTATILGQRGGAGGESRYPPSGGTTAGPACAPRLASAAVFTLVRGSSRAVSEQRAAQVAELVEAEGWVIVEEWRDDARRIRVAVATWPPVPEAEFVRLAEACPGYVAGSVEVVP